MIWNLRTIFISIVSFTLWVVMSFDMFFHLSKLLIGTKLRLFGLLALFILIPIVADGLGRIDAIASYTMAILGFFATLYIVSDDLLTQYNISDLRLLILGGIGLLGIISSSGIICWGIFAAEPNKKPPEYTFSRES